jgi:hypothetical protein
MAVGTVSNADLILGTNSARRVRFLGNSDTVEFGSGMTHAIVNNGLTFQNASSRAVKQDVRNLTAAEAYEALHGLQPVRFAYIADPAHVNVGFIAEDVPDLVASADRAHLSAMDIVGVLTKVVQEQDFAIAEQRVAIADLRAANAAFQEALAEMRGELARVSGR